MKRTILD